MIQCNQGKGGNTSERRIIQDFMGKDFTTL